MAPHFDFFSAGIPSSRFYERGKFGRMFASLPPCQKDEDASLCELTRIADRMSCGTNPNVYMAAGYTYLGQFILHDISFDPTSIAERQVDPEFLWNFRTPAFDLDSIYGSGPFGSPHLYHDLTHFNTIKKRIGEEKYCFYDIPRMQTTRMTGIIADPRNDDNIIISQLHAAFLEFHNRIADKLASQNKEYYEKNPHHLFLNTQKMVRWYFQWIILYDYLPRIIDLSEHNDVHKKVRVDAPYEEKVACARNQIKWMAEKKRNRRFYDWRNEPFIPLEFSLAAFRFGHSQVLKSYQFNPDFSNSLFTEDYYRSKNPFARIDFRHFFPEGKKMPLPNKLIGPHISDAMSKIPRPGLPDLNIALRNLERGLYNHLPSGQSIAKAMGLTPIRIGDKPECPPMGEFAIQASKKLHSDVTHFPEHLKGNTPLWYYILYEAYHKQGGQKLGPVGSRIVAEVLVGLIQGDRSSFLSQDPAWIPQDQHGNEKEDFDMVDLLKIAEVYEPLIYTPTAPPLPPDTPWPPEPPPHLSSPVHNPLSDTDLPSSD